jgi:nucleotide-binding universal stress UspA family protein
MVIVCGIGRQHGPELLQRLVPLVAPGPEVLLVHVIDDGPRQRWEQVQSPFRPGPKGRADRRLQMERAEHGSAEAILAEAQAHAQQLGLRSLVRVAQGTPERALVDIAQETAAALVVVGARDLPDGHPALGPASVGRTARFVLDHAPCPVLLLR